MSVFLNDILNGQQLQIPNIEASVSSKREPYKSVDYVTIETFDKDTIMINVNVQNNTIYDLIRTEQHHGMENALHKTFGFELINKALSDINMSEVHASCVGSFTSR